MGFLRPVPILEGKKSLKTSVVADKSPIYAAFLRQLLLAFPRFAVCIKVVDT